MLPTYHKLSFDFNYIVIQMEWCIVANEDHWEDLLENIIHRGFRLHLSSGPPHIEWNLYLDKSNGKLNRLDMMTHFLQLIRKKPVSTSLFIHRGSFHPFSCRNWRKKINLQFIHYLPGKCPAGGC